MSTDTFRQTKQWRSVAVGVWDRHSKADADEGVSRGDLSTVKSSAWLYDYKDGPRTFEGIST